jgi:hypothetical protein
MIQDIMRVCPVEAKLFHVDRQTEGQTELTKPLVAFCNFINMPKNDWSYISACLVCLQVMQRDTFFLAKVSVLLTTLTCQKRHH